MQTEERMIAVCGLDCTDCDIRKVPTDDEAAKRVVGWFRAMGWLKEDEGVPEIIERSMYCQGCRGDRSVHWSAECKLLTCCVDQKGATACYECDDFVCEHLEEWVQSPPPGQEKKYADALDRLRAMRAQASA